MQNLAPGRGGVGGGGGGGGVGWRRTLEARSQAPENEGKIVEIGDRVRIQRTHSTPIINFSPEITVHASTSRSAHAWTTRKPLQMHTWWGH